MLCQIFTLIGSADMIFSIENEIRSFNLNSGKISKLNIGSKNSGSNLAYDSIESIAIYYSKNTIYWNQMVINKYNILLIYFCIVIKIYLHI